MQAAGHAALTGGKKVMIYFRTDPAENPGGCQATDCRKLTGIAVVN